MARDLEVSDLAELPELLELDTEAVRELHAQVKELSASRALRTYRADAKHSAAVKALIDEAKDNVFQPMFRQFYQQFVADETARRVAEGITEREQAIKKAMEDQHRKEIDDLGIINKQNLENDLDEQKKTIEQSMRSKHQEEINKLVTQHTEALRRERETYTKTLDTMVETHRQTLKSKDESLEEVRSSKMTLEKARDDQTTSNNQLYATSLQVKQDEIDKLKKDLKSVRAAHSTLEADRDGIRSELAQIRIDHTLLGTTRDSLEGELEQTKARYTTLKADRDEIKDGLGEYENKVQDLAQKLEDTELLSSTVLREKESTDEEYRKLDGQYDQFRREYGLDMERKKNELQELDRHHGLRFTAERKRARKLDTELNDAREELTTTKDRLEDYEEYVPDLETRVTDAEQHVVDLINEKYTVIDFSWRAIERLNDITHRLRADRDGLEEKIKGLLSTSEGQLVKATEAGIDRKNKLGELEDGMDEEM